ncbi:hypothetical protein EYF80_041643 [Liparis tanakae]|uniref:Uncharacterized protein n=1 Tax=Liparis tanakae TaxID=230148 RepID=A0A4Z2G5M9_9TELE|nr:hypothetical protein EYF80_041643 [Liparis tanakae]
MQEEPGGTMQPCRSYEGTMTECHGVGVWRKGRREPSLWARLQAQRDKSYPAAIGLTTMTMYDRG